MNALDTGVYNKLIGDSDLVADVGSNIFNMELPQGTTASKYVIFSRQGGPGDENICPRRLKNYVYSVQAISKSSLKEAGATDDLIDACLHNQSLSVTGWGCFWMARESDIRYIEAGPGGEPYYHAGGLYRVRLYKSS